MPTIRIAQSKDTAHLAAIGLRSWAGAVAGLADVDAMRRKAEDAFVYFLRDHAPAVTVAERDGVPVGWAAREKYDGSISDLWVDPAFQRQGVGTALVAALEADMLAAGIPSADILTHAQNAPAIAFFQRRGYRIHWLSTQYSARLDRDVESVGMIRDLVEPGADGTGYGSV
ncbi:ribosomal-protein-alanine N-acetyltransferase [Rhizobium sp. RU20A]|uniref:GNAT family N-acetyltransferase n=1 Tax=Rhizobium sp. RU20A TaxID=1907412 RepID=UPI000955F33B|nr:GNAT family N-acetyltransferase [Rhizobium sp. RU20A]SIP98469.1 ribosomal-protein-alanine N-acetyltransferase [Rhizobium sp. RU20A]